jgi:hypothetical protein
MTVYRKPQAAKPTKGGSNPCKDKKFYPFLKGLDRLWGLPNLLFNCYCRGGSISRGEAGRAEADQSPPSSAEVKNSGTELRFTQRRMVIQHQRFGTTSQSLLQGG